MLSTRDGDGALLRPQEGVPAPSWITRRQMNQQAQRGYVALQGRLIDDTLDTLDDQLAHQRVENSLRYQAREVQTAVCLSQLTPEAEPYLRPIVAAAATKRVRTIREAR